MKELPYSLNIRREKWDKDSKDYIPFETETDLAQDIQTSDGFDFGGLSIRMTRNANWNDGGQAKILFETKKNERKILESGVTPAKILATFHGRTLHKLMEGRLATKDEFKPKSDLDWEAFNKMQLEEFEKPSKFFVSLGEGLPSQIEVYAETKEEHPERLVFEFVGPGIGEGTNALLN